MIMDCLPKLLPSWHDEPLQEIIRQKYNKHFAPLYPPDYGGIGLDVTVNSDVSCKIPKYFQSQLMFASDRCALPFVPLKKAIRYNDPCLESLEKEKNDFDKFCRKLKHLRIQSMKEVSFYHKLKTLEKDIHASNSHDDDEDKAINIFAPPSIVQLAERMPERIVVPEFNAAYAGGTLASCKLSDRQTLIHPKCGHLNKLCITPLLDDHEQHFIPDLSGQKTVGFKNEPVLQVEQALDGFCVRQENSFHLVNMPSTDTYSKKIGKSVLYHIAASPFNPTDILSVYEKGKLKLRNMLTGKTVWSISEDFYDDPFLMYPTWRCGFGSHPFSAMCMNQKKLYKFDFRKENKPVELIFKMAENSSFYVGEDLVSFKQWNKNSFQYFLTSDHHLILCDERYPKTSVMTWNHCLKNSPLYLEYAYFNSNVSIIVIGSQKNPQLASFVCSHQTDVQPVSLSPPLHLSSTSDCIESLKLHCHYIDDKIASRFSHPLTGICILPSKLKNGFTVLQSTSLGDIFYQDFRQSSVATEKTYHVSTGCILTPPEKILPSVKHLVSQQNSEKVSDEELSGESTTVVEDNDDVDILHNQPDRTLTPQKKISANCMFCRLYSAADDTELVNSETCPSCHMSKDESEHFSKALSSDSALIGPTSDKAGSLHCDAGYLSKFDDKYSKRILSIWLDSDPLIDDENELINTREIPDERQNGSPVCDEGPLASDTLTDVINSIPETPQDQMPSHVCDVCQKVYLTKWSLRRHQEIHKGKTFTCNICQRVFLRKFTLDRHQKIHKGNIFTCDICQKEFSRKDAMDAHRQRHVCNICLQVFSHKDAMFQHRKTHRRTLKRKRNR